MTRKETYKVVFAIHCGVLHVRRIVEWFPLGSFDIPVRARECRVLEAEEVIYLE